MCTNFRYLLLIAALFCFSTITNSSFAQESETAEKQEESNAAKAVAAEEEEEELPRGYAFEIVNSVKATDVKSQDSTGTCWCFATASFMESELIRMNKGQHNISEMFIVRNIYKEKARNYVHRSGKANFSEGALAHDFMNAVRRYGMMPEEAYNGLDEGADRHDHGEMSAVLKGFLDSLVAQRTLSKKWEPAFSSVLDVYLGAAPESFEYRGAEFTPQEFSNSLGFDTRDYINVTSFIHHPFGESFVLEIPDNFSNGSFYNVPIDDLVATIDNAIENGYSVAWDGDVSERGFDRNSGIAIMPANGRPNFREPSEEIEVTQESRQATFEEHSTTDDHLMHLTGIAKDKLGNKYYLIKNSWGEVGKHEGYLYMSEAYVRAKTMAILVHKDALVDVEVSRPAEEATADESSSLNGNSSNND